MSGRNKLNIVIVGGGGVAVGLLGLSQLGKKIDRSKYRIVLVNPRPFYVHLRTSHALKATRALKRAPVQLSALVQTVTSDGNFGERALLPFEGVLEEDDELVVGTAASIQRPDGATGGQVILENGVQVPFAILVLGTGSRWPDGLNWPNTKEEIRGWLADRYKRIADAKSIVVAGAGAVGLEISGELRHCYPNTEVTLVQKAAHVLNDAYPDRFRSFAEKQLRETGVKIILDDTVMDGQPENGVVKTAKGRHVAADLLQDKAVGTTPNTEFLRSLPDALSSTGHVKVQPTMQLISYPEIFAAGDIIETKQQRNISKCPPQAAVITANIVALTKGTQPANKYSGYTEALALLFGPSIGALYIGILWGLVFGSWVTTSLKKSDDLFLAKTAATLNCKPS